jgi:catechol 2,3-dioxygenase-like lactoylglutathione lyase family enzyme
MAAASGDDAIVIGRLHHIVLDCPDPMALAAFYAELLGWQVTHTSGDWAVVAPSHDHSGLAMQLAPDHQPPVWGDAGRPQQVHVDVMVDDRSAAHEQVLALGARRLTPAGASGDVYADPAGHPFCLIDVPWWAPPVHGTALQPHHGDVKS